MFTKDANDEVDSFILIHWLLMTVCAGMMNTVAFIGLGTFATHVTGFATLIGVQVADFHFSNAFTALMVPVFFLLGTVISGLCVEGRVRNNKPPHYDYVMYACGLLLFLACWLGGFNEYHPEQNDLHLKNNFALLSLICLTSGLLNATLSHSSHSTVRITHLTGITTDLGRGIAELISIGKQATKMKTELKLNTLRALTILSFVLGAVVAAFLFRKVFFNVLLAPAAYFVYAGFHGRKIKSAQRLLND